MSGIKRGLPAGTVNRSNCLEARARTLRSRMTVVSTTLTCLGAAALTQFGGSPAFADTTSTPFRGLSPMSGSVIDSVTPTFQAEVDPNIAQPDGTQAMPGLGRSSPITNWN